MAALAPDDRYIDLIVCVPTSMSTTSMVCSPVLTSGERWTTVDALAADYRTRYGARTHIVLTYPDLSYQTTAFADSVDWHPSQRDHQILAAALTGHLATLSIAW